MSFIESLNEKKIYGFALIVLIAALVAIVGYQYYKNEKNNILQQHADELERVTSFKTRQISAWYEDEIKDAKTISRDGFLLRLIGDWLKEKSGTDKENLRKYLKTIVDEHNYKDISLVDSNGKVLMSVNNKKINLNPVVESYAEKSLKRQEILSTGFYRSKTDNAILIAFLSPVTNIKDGLNCALIFEEDPEPSVFTVVRSWPVPGETSETVLLKKDADGVIFLSKPRFVDNKALEFNVPANERDLVEVRSVNGVRGVIEGKDYRGSNVLAYASPVKGTPWHIITKIDNREVFEGLKYEIFILLTLAYLLILLAAGTLFLIYNRRQRDLYKKLWRAEEEFRTILYSIGDAVISTDMQGNIKALNNVAEQLTDWTESEAKGKPLEKIFHIIDEETRARVDNPVQYVINKGVVTGIANHTLLISRNGREIPIADSGAPVKNRDGEIVGVVIVFMDQTSVREASRKLKESERELSRIFNIIPAIIYKVKLDDLTPLWVSENVKKILGYTVDEVLNREWWISGIYPEDRERAISNANDIYSKKHLVHEYRFYKKNGEVIWVRDELSLLDDQEDSEPVIVGAWVDITESKYAEMELHESEERYRELFKANPHPMWVYDLDSLKILEVNDSAVAHYGYSREEFLSMTIKELRPSEDIPGLLDNISSVDEGLDRAGIWRHRLKDGSIIYVEITSHTLTFDGHHAEVVLANDITDRKKSEEALLRSQELLRATLDSLSEAVFLVDPGDRTIKLCNRAACEMFGYRMEELLGDNTLKLHVDREHYEDFAEQSQKILNSGEEYRGEFELKRSSGEVFPTEHEIRSISSEAGGWEAGVVSVVRDITERKNSEQEKERLQRQLFQAQKMESIGKLAGGVAHDFNNMLQAILGYVELALTRTGTDTELTQDLNEIRKVTLRSAELTRQLLAFARKQVVSPVLMDLNEMVSGMLKMLHRLIREDIELVWIPGKNLWPVKMDPAQIDQILANLCANANDAIDGKGKITIETCNKSIDESYVAIYPYFVPGDYVLLSVSDDGCGMEKEVVEHIFEPFFTTKDVNKGTGLGMATVYGIIKQNKGFVNVYSEPGEGTTVRIYFPRQKGYFEEAETTERKIVKEGAGETILLVEDEPSILEMGKMLLEELGYRVYISDNPEDAVGIAGEHSEEIDLLITDVIMPQMDGHELAARIRGEIPGLKCLFMSGYTFDIISRNVELQEDEYFIQKPFTSDDLASKVAEILASGDDNL